MMRQRFHRMIKTTVFLLLFMALIVPTGISTNKAQAATKPAIDTETSIGLGSIRANDYFYFKGDKFTLEVYDAVKNATYSFTSSDKNIVTVKSKGKTAYLTGVKAGSATITCQQKLKGRTTKVGTCKVTVCNSKIFAESDEVPQGKNDFTLVSFVNRNCSATYSYTSNSKDFTVKESVKKSNMGEGAYSVSQIYNAKKPGTYTVTVNETYNKKTRKVGTVKIKVNKALVADEDILYAGDSMGAFEIVTYARTDVNYRFSAGEDGIVETYLDKDGNIYIKGLKAGVATVKIYENATDKSEGNYIGSCKITVKELKVESIDSSFYDTKTYVGGDPIGVEVYKEPDNAPEKITITSSDPTIATVSEVNEDGYAEIKPLKKGKVTITITCGEFTNKETITVYANEDEMYGY